MANHDQEGQALIQAVKTGDEETVVSLLEDYPFLIEKLTAGETALHAAVFNDRENIVRLLLSENICGANIKEIISMKDKVGRTPLHISVYRGNVQITEILCQNGSPKHYHDKSGKTPLLIAVLQNNPEMVTCLVNHGAFSASAYSFVSQNPFHVAIQKNFKTIVEIFVQHVDMVDICSCPSYPDPAYAEEIFNRRLEMQNTKDNLKGKRKRRKETALHYAASYGHDYQVKRLIESGAKVNAIVSGNTPLQEAVKNNHLSTVDYLLTQLADVNVVDLIGLTPLYYATKVTTYPPNSQQKDFEKSLKIMQLLLINGASVHHFDAFQKTPLHYAVEEEEFPPEKTRHLLLFGANASAQQEGGLTPMFFAKSPAAVQMLIEKGANIDAVNSQGRSPLHDASKVTTCQNKFEESLKKMKILLEHGASVHLFDKDHKTPLHYAVEEEKFRPEKIILLLDYKADVNAQQDGGPTPIFFAKCAETVQMLIEKGANIDAVNSEGRSLLHNVSEISTLSTSRNNFEESLKIMKILLEHGASVHIFDINDKTPLHYAVEGHEFQTEKMLLLLDYKADVNAQKDGGGPTPILFAKYAATVQMLIEKGANIKAVNSQGSSLLHDVSKVITYWQNTFKFEESLKIMKILLKHGASVHLFDMERKTPLHYAVKGDGSQAEKILLLLDYKADVNAQQDGHPTPIFFAKSVATMQRLIEKGANVNYRISSEDLYTTPLHYAIKENNLMKVNLLLDSGAEVDSSTVRILTPNPEINERILDRRTLTTPVIEFLLENRRDDNNIIPFLAVRYFQGEVIINSKQFFSKFGIFFSRFKTCQEELERMRDVQILNLSLCDILSMPFKKLRSYAAKKEVLEFFKSRTLQDEFPVYSGIIIRRFQRAKEARNLIDSSWVVFEKMIFCNYKKRLPNIAVYEILDLLFVSDLRKLLKL